MREGTLGMGDGPLVAAGVGFLSLDCSSRLVVEGFGEGGDVGAVTGVGGLLPLWDVVELVDLFEAVEERVVAQGVELVAAEIVRAALHVADLQWAVFFSQD